MIVLCAPRAAQTTLQFATQTPACPAAGRHADLNTPASLTDVGQAFHANGNTVLEKK